MVNYEVNLVIQNEIYSEYYEWLVKHIKIMLKIDGFKKAIVQKLDDVDDKHNHHLVVHYILTSKEALDGYLTNYAPEMRNDGIKRFGQKCIATRRVLEEIQVLDNEMC